MLETLRSIKAKHTALCAQVTEIAAAQKESMDSIRNNLGSVMGLIQHFQETTDVEVHSQTVHSLLKHHLMYSYYMLRKSLWEYSKAFECQTVVWWTFTAIIMPLRPGHEPFSYMHMQRLDNFTCLGHISVSTATFCTRSDQRMISQRWRQPLNFLLLWSVYCKHTNQLKVQFQQKQIASNGEKINTQSMYMYIVLRMTLNVALKHMTELLPKKIVIRISTPAFYRHSSCSCSVFVDVLQVQPPTESVQESAELLGSACIKTTSEVRPNQQPGTFYVHC